VTLQQRSPDARFVVTSRPAAAPQDWLDSEEFLVAELLPMSNSNIDVFVRRWFAAVREGVLDSDARQGPDALESSLIGAISARLHLRRLAGYPLLCALICALYRDRKSQLPGSRMELYDVALQMLLERRDAEREISDMNHLSRTSKLLLLGDIAYWLVRNNWSDANTREVIDRIDKKLLSMSTVKESGDSVYRHLVERTGLLREPAYARTDFVHRTFQEYLAAKAAVEDGDIGVLADHAHLDTGMKLLSWRLVTVHARSVSSCLVS
jgi:predicted NACHT family NTPase